MERSLLSSPFAPTSTSSISTIIPSLAPFPSNLGFSCASLLSTFPIIGFPVRYRPIWATEVVIFRDSMQVPSKGIRISMATLWLLWKAEGYRFWPSLGSDSEVGLWVWCLVSPLCVYGWELQKRRWLLKKGRLVNSCLIIELKMLQISGMILNIWEYFCGFSFLFFFSALCFSLHSSFEVSSPFPPSLKKKPRGLAL